MQLHRKSTDQKGILLQSLSIMGSVLGFVEENHELTQVGHLRVHQVPMNNPWCVGHTASHFRYAGGSSCGLGALIALCWRLPGSHNLIVVDRPFFFAALQRAGLPTRKRKIGLLGPLGPHLHHITWGLQRAWSPPLSPLAGGFTP